MKLIEKTTSPNNSRVQSRIYWDAVWQEYRVRLFVDDKHWADVDYFAGDLQDAKHTASYMRANAENTK